MNTLEKHTFNRKKKKLMKEISHTTTLLEVIPCEHIKYFQTKYKLEKLFDEFKGLMWIKKDERLLSKLN